MFGRLLMGLVRLLCAVTGIGSLLVGLGFLRETYVFLRTATRRVGEVIAIIEDDHDSSYPVVRFQLPDGESVELGIRVGSMTCRVGQRVEVLYDPQQPQSARIRNFWELWFPAIGFMGFGVLFLGMAGAGIFGG